MAVLQPPRNSHGSQSGVPGSQLRDYRSRVTLHADSRTRGETTSQHDCFINETAKTPILLSVISYW